jgi:uncharacterized protein (TIGR03437 family)
VIHSGYHLGAIARVVLTLAAFSIPIRPAVPATVPALNALWVYSVTSLPNPVTDETTRDTLVQNGSSSGVSMLYVSVYSSTPNSAGHYMYEDSDIADLISKAHAQGMQVYAAYGDSDWPTRGCAASEFPMLRMAEVVAYNSANQSALFDGVILDVEPSGTPDFQALLELYQCFQQQAQAHGMGLSVAISAFWSTTVTFGQTTEEAYKQIVDLKLNSVVVMGYRNFAGTSDCTQGDGVVCLDENVIAYANRVSQGNTIVVGLDTDNPATSGSTAEETFFSMGQTAMNAVAQSVFNQFTAVNQTFGGFSIHNYRDSYLNGQLSGWPATNPPLANPAPAIGSGGVVSASAFGEFTSVSPGSWIEIYGSNLAVDSRFWTASDFSGGNAPTSLDGTSVTIGGRPAFIDFISPGQVNALVPSNIPTGVQSMTVTVGSVTSAAYGITVNPVQPGLDAPPSFNIGGIQYAVAQFADGTYALPEGAIAGINSRPAQPGDEVILYGVGFGPVTPNMPAGQLVQQANTLASEFNMSIGGVPAHVLYSGLAPDYTSLYQFNVVVPANSGSGAVPLTFTIGGAAGTQTLVLAVGN